MVPRLKASPRHGGAKKFAASLLVTDPPRGLPIGSAGVHPIGIWGHKPPSIEYSCPHKKTLNSLCRYPLVIDADCTHQVDFPEKRPIRGAKVYCGLMAVCQPWEEV